MSKLDSFLSTMLTDDEALKEFLADPISSEEKHGLRKAERSVVRRVVRHLPPTAKSGFSMQRSLASHRRSLRLLQNVMHGVAASHGLTTTDAEETAAGVLVRIYYTGNPDMPAGLLDNPSLSYAYNCYINAPSSASTVAEALNFDGSAGGHFPAYQSGVTGQKIVSYTVVNKGTSDKPQYYIDSFTIPSGFAGPGTYKLNLPTSLSKQEPFWFYSLNGEAITNQNGIYLVNPDAREGSEGKSFTDTPLTSSDTSIIWQAIAPDATYGFAICK